MTPRARGPLDGVRIVDLTRLLPGAYATLLLADLGAGVVKIEDPRGGDPVRAMPPLAQGTGVYFQLLNRNKRSVTLDLRSAEAAGVLDALLSRADVVVDSFRPQAARRLGVDAATLRARHPRLICASITGFGQTGPYVARAAHDINYEALSGLLALGVETPPEVPRMLIGDIGAAMHAAAGILAALFQRERTGGGATVDVAIHEAALAWLLFPAARQLVAGADADVRDLPIAGRDACYNVYRTADDRYLALGALEPKFWAAFCGRLGRPDLAARQGAQGEAQTRVLAEVRSIMLTRTRDEWLAFFGDLDVCLTPVNSIAEALADPHLRARAALVPHGDSTYIATPISTAQSAEIRPAPALGAHTDEELDAAGVDAATRAALRARGTIAMIAMIARALRWFVPLALFGWVGWQIGLVRYWVLCAILVTWLIYVSRSVDPTLMRERFSPAGPTVDRYAMVAIRGAAVLGLALTLLDLGHFHWSDTVQPFVRVAAMTACVASLALLARAMIANRFFSSAIRLQPDRGHRVVHAGPYAVIRHPGYLAMAAVMPALALALGSWAGLVPSLIYSVLILRRAAVEDQYLRANLDGYAEYASRVRFRVLPGVW